MLILTSYTLQNSGVLYAHVFYMDLQPLTQFTHTHARRFYRAKSSHMHCITLKSIGGETAALCPSLSGKNFRAAALTACFLSAKRETEGRVIMRKVSELHVEKLSKQ